MQPLVQFETVTLQNESWVILYLWFRGMYFSKQSLKNGQQSCIILGSENLLIERLKNLTLFRIILFLFHCKKIKRMFMLKIKDWLISKNTELSCFLNQFTPRAWQKKRVFRGLKSIHNLITMRNRVYLTNTTYSYEQILHGSVDPSLKQLQV